MDEIILNYILQAILGGAAGYITNDYAINMLFKEYTPLKIGGVIKKTRFEFIENLSTMVDNDIINKNEIKNILNDENFKKEFEVLTADFYENCLYETVDNNTFANVEDIDNTIQSTDIFVEKIINEHMADIYGVMLESFDLSSFLTTEQMNKIKHSLFLVLTEIINDTDIIEKMVMSVYKNNEKLILGNVLDNDTTNTIIHNVASIVIDTLKSKETNLKGVLDSTGIKDAFICAQEILYTRKLNEIVNLDIDVINDINIMLLSYVNSEKGFEYIDNLVNSLFSYGKNCNKSIFQLLDSSFEENLKLYLMNNIPSVTENIVDWINENNNLINYLIEESIDEVIKESDGFKAKLLSVIKNTYYSSLSKKYSIVDKIITYVKKITEPEKLSENLSARLIDILSNLNLSEIISEAENNNITPESTRKFVINYINKNSEAFINNIAEYLSEIELKQILPKDFLLKNITKLLSSNTVESYLSSGLKTYSINTLSKELSSIVNEKQAVDISKKLKVFIIDKLTSNETTFKNLIATEVMSTTKEVNQKELSSDTVGLLNDEIYKSYKQTTEKIKSTPISEAFDKLNSIDNINKNSSESLRLYAVKNTDVILSGSIKAIVNDNLNKLSDDELVNLANDFIGRELKPIMYFGGILGVAAGLILATFQGSNLNPGETNIANMAVYAFVGYITNLIAINMIFKPYKENKLLSKVPFFKNFSLGYIVKNQKIFAKNTAHFIDNSLLSKKSIAMLFDKYKDNIKSTFAKSIADNNYKTLTSLLSNNKGNVINSVFSFIKNKVNNNTNKISSYFYNKIANIKLNTLITDNTIKKISIRINEKLHSSDIGNKLYSIISSDNILKSKFSGNSLKNIIFSAENHFYTKANNILSNENEFNLGILKYEEKYQNFTNKHLNELINSEKTEKLAQATATKISSIVLNKEQRDTITHKLFSFISKSLDKTKTFEEIFEGKFKKYINSRMPRVFENMSSAIISNIKNSKSKISVMIQSEIKGQLGFIEKGMYNLMGGDEIIDELLAKIIVVKVPRFIEDKKQELMVIADDMLENKFYKTRIDVLYTGLNKLQFNDIVKSYIDNNNLKIENKINEITKDLFIKASHMKINNLTTVFNINELDSFINIYNSELNAFRETLNNNLKSNKEVITKELLDFNDRLIDEFMETKFNKVFSGISHKDLNIIIDNAFKELDKNNLEKIICSTLEETNINIKTTLGDITNKNEFMKSAEHYFATLIENPEFEKIIKEHFGKIIDEALIDNFNFISDETKNYTLNIFTDSCINSLKRNLDLILKSVEFDKIAKEEIEKMEPEKIHKMFNSFGEKYFNRLILYGFGGFVFGINMYVGFTLTALKVLSEIINRKE